MKSGVYSVDTIENDVIRIEMRENQEILILPKNVFPDAIVSEIKEGDILEIVTSLFGKIKECKILKDMTKKIKEENAKKLDSLFDN